jgi:DMSO/TMAO reductase YedYZ molybdopterin-dependent catalytic subunit
MDHATSTPPGATATACVDITGDVLQPLSLSLEALRRLDSVRAEPFDLRCFTTGRFIRRVDAYRGVRLTELLTRAGLRCVDPGDFKRMIVVASAHDGYAVTFSWHELFNTAIGEQAIVAYACGEQALDETAGAPVLHSGADRVPAPRHVKRLVRIDVRVVMP